MSTKPLSVTVATLLIVVLIAPTVFFVAPQRASAQVEGALSCIITTFGLGLSSNPATAAANASGLAGGVASFVGVPVVNTAVTGILGQTAASAGTNAATAASPCLEKFWKAIAKAGIHYALQTVTGDIVNWINGRNGTGQPSFVRNLSNHLQQLGDSIALPFITLAQRVSNPAFQAAMLSSLLTKYAIGSSVGGFLAGNQGTLNRFSQNPNAFLAGNWSQNGGVSAWFALTTQNNNNPFITIPAADAQLRSLVNQGSINRRQDLAQGKGFLSWCGPKNPASVSTGAGINPAATAPGCAEGESIQTPGSVIQAQIQQVLGADVAQLINPTDIDASFAAIITAFITQGVKGLMSSLYAGSETSSTNSRSAMAALQATAAANLASLNSANAAATAANSNLLTYTNAWTTIESSANTAKSSITSLKTSCAAQATAADTALVRVNAVLVQAQTAASAAQSKRALALQVQEDTSDTTAAGVTKLNADKALLVAAPPTTADVSSANADAIASTPSSATASPAGSLSVSGGTLVDQMSLMSTNAAALMNNSVMCPVSDPGAAANAVTAATTAVIAAEASKSASTVTPQVVDTQKKADAQALVTALPSGQAKTDLQARLNAL